MKQSACQASSDRIIDRALYDTRKKQNIVFYLYKHFIQTTAYSFPEKPETSIGWLRKIDE